MNLTPEIESMMQHTCQGVLCVLPVVPLLLYVVVYCYTLLAPVIVQLVKWRSQGLSMRRGTGVSPVSGVTGILPVSYGGQNARFTGVRQNA